MEFKLNSKKSLLEVVAFGVVLYWGLNHWKLLGDMLAWCVGVLTPFLLGGAIAFVLNVPMKFVEGHISRLISGKKMLVRFLSMLLAFALAFGVIIFVIMTVIPELINTITALNKGFPAFIDSLDHWVRGLNSTYPEITDYIASIELNWSKLSETALNVLQSSVTNVLNSTWGVATSVIGGLTTTFLGLVFSMYILAQKEKLGKQFKKLLLAYLPKKRVAQITGVGKLTHKTFSGFIAGQCTEAVIFGLLCYLGMLIFRFPYALSVSVLIGFTTLIPVLGAFLGTALGAILILVTNPIQAFWFVVMIIVLQQIDENLIYPRVVGSSVGLPGLWVMVAVTLGGSIMGVLGMLIFVPMVSVLYALLRSSVNIRLGKRSIDEETAESL